MMTMEESGNIGSVIESVRRFTVLVRSGRSGTGSGVVVGTDGAIVTNAHVIHGSRLTVELWDGKSVPASVQRIDRNRDLALLSARASGLSAAIIGNSGNLKVGDLVIAVGNPFGFLGAASVGIVHSRGPISRMGAGEWIRSDVRLAPGNSGGPLSDARGEVVGLNTMIVDRLGVAIPSNAVRRFIGSAKSDEMLGVAVRPLNLKVQENECIGFLILEISEGSPAERASLLPGDLLIGTDRRLFGSADDLYEALSGEGERSVRLRFIRGDDRRERLATALLGSNKHKAA